MKVGKYISQPYLSARNDKEDVDGRVVVVDTVFPENINGQDKLCMRFKGIAKPLVLNQTNVIAMSSAYGDDTDAWVSQKITLVVVGVMFNGALVDSIQIRTK